MAAPYRDAATFRAALVESGLLVPTAAQGLWHRSGEFEDVVLGLGRYIEKQRISPALRRVFPPLIALDSFLATDYLRSFPDMIGSVEIFSGGDSEHRALLSDLADGIDWTGHLTASEVVLSSSVCHSLYGTLPTSVPTAGVNAEVTGFVFRHEPSPDPARMQSFRQFDYVHIGTPEAALAHRDLWQRRGAAALAALGLPVRVEAANDPFFGRVGKVLASNQLDAALKYEVIVDNTDERPTAISSANYHEDHFGSAFGLRLPDGSVAHSACFGFGLERIALSLFAHHGLEVDAWPADVLGALA